MAGSRRPADFRRQVFSVSEITSRIRTLLENMPAVCVRGEVSGARVSPSGHLYFTLFDKDARLECIAYRRVAHVVKDVAKDGSEIIAAGSISFYPPSGRLQMIVEHAEPSGPGRARAELVKLMKRLQEEGLFDEERKVPLPAFPRRVAVITSPNGAAVHDVIVSIHERCRGMDILVVPVPVQGTAAPAEISRSVAIVDKKRLADVIIVGRGGGADEDLAAFNDEAVVRAVAACRIPIVSAVGHEIDVTLTDLAADVRAPTPTAAAKMVAPDTRELLERLAGCLERMEACAARHVSKAASRLGAGAEDLRRLSPRRRVDELGERLDLAAGRLKRALCHSVAIATGNLARIAERMRARSPAMALRGWRARVLYTGKALSQSVRSRLRVGNLTVEKHAAALKALNPLAVIGRGYSITLGADARPLRSIDDTRPGESIETRLRDGTIRSRVEEKREHKENG